MSARLKINYFTPLSPEHTAIADFSHHVLLALAEHADVAVWTYQRRWDVIAASGLTIRRFLSADGPRQIPSADMTFFNMSNNILYHREIFEMSRQIPGIIILHEPNLQYFFAALARTSADHRKDYMRTIARHYGDEGVAAAEALFSRRLKMDRMLIRYPMTETALENALAVVTHDRNLRRNVETSTGLPSFYLPLAHHTNDNEPLRRSKRAPPHRLVSFGYMGKNRRLDAVARAVLSQSKDSFVWDLYGEYPSGLVPFWARWRLGRRMCQHGFVESGALDEALGAADLATNLRNPTMGETSSTQLRIWDRGLPALVSRVGWYADQPPDTVLFVEPGNEVEGIATHLRNFLADPEPFYEAGRRGRAYVKRAHDPALYAKGLIEIAGKVAS